MIKPLDLVLWDWNKMIDSFHSESDRGAAVLAGGFVENYLGVFLKHFIVDKKVGDDLFGAFGPLSSFSQRIALARAYGFISRAHYNDLTIVRQVRNHFAHHPLEATFATPKIAELCLKLSQHKTAEEEHPNEGHSWKARTAYLLSCGMFCGVAHQRMEKQEKED